MQCKRFWGPLVYVNLDLSCIWTTGQLHRCPLPAHCIKVLINLKHF